MPYIPPLASNGYIHNAFPRSIDSTPLAYVEPYALPIRVHSLENTTTFNASAIFALHQQHTRQVVATVFSSVSLAAALLAIYWFYMMRRNFRRDLVLLLIVGGSWKSLWFILFSVVTFANGPISTESKFCQASGYLLQVGFEACDLAVLFMSMHMYLQIFPPSRFGLGHDGLYRIRYWVYASWFVLPNLSAALAFVNPHPGYMAQGGFCSMPIRPLWYRLALFFGPRYLIWLYVMYVAIRIYRYVGREFKVFGQEKDRSSSLTMPGESSIDLAAKAEQDRIQIARHSQRLSSIGFDSSQDKDSCAPDDISRVGKIRSTKTQSYDFAKSHPFTQSRRQSVPVWAGGPNALETETTVAGPATKSLPGSRRGSKQVPGSSMVDSFGSPSKFNSGGHRGSITSIASKRSSTAPSIDGSLAPIQESRAASVELQKHRQSANKTMELRRRAIQRQLRLLFIYPCIYMFFWVIPLVVNIMNYNDHFAQHPIFALGVVQTVCVTVMTTADVLVFCWRERPWHHIPGSDGTFLGSLMWWQFCFKSSWAAERRASRVPSFVPGEKSADDEHSSPRVLRSIKRWSGRRKRSSLLGSEASGATPSFARRTPHTRQFSGGSDRKRMEIEMAHQRLALERAEYEQNRQSLQERRTSVISRLQQQSTPERKEWFDRELKGELFKDNEKNGIEKRPEAS